MPPARWPATHAPLAPELLSELSRQLAPRVARFAAREQLQTEHFCTLLKPLLLPLAGWLALQRLHLGRCCVLGIAGAQGTGKTTLAALLELLLTEGFGLTCARLSLDDLYLTRAERERLGHDVHPLLRTRGVPGTHDVALGLQVLAALRRATPADRVPLPRFDKAMDDRLPETEWAVVSGAIDCVLFDGWCLGARPQDPAALAAPLNALERDEDKDASWRRHVNAQLEGAYGTLFEQLDRLLFLVVPDLPVSLAWRTEQERKLAACAPGSHALMGDAELARFVQHYERISRHMLAELPARADVTLRLDADHHYTTASCAETASARAARTRR